MSIIFQYDNQRANFKFKFIWIRVSRKEMAEVVRTPNYIWTIQVPNPAALTISFF